MPERDSKSVALLCPPDLGFMPRVVYVEPLQERPGRAASVVRSLVEVQRFESVRQPHLPASALVNRGRASVRDLVCLFDTAGEGVASLSGKPQSPEELGLPDAGLFPVVV